MTPWKVKWDLLIIAMAIYNCITMPLELSFVPDVASSSHLAWANLFIDFCYFIDMILSFRTSYINPMTGSEIVSKREVTINYLTGRFWVDLISTVPFDMLVKKFGNEVLKRN